MPKDCWNKQTHEIMVRSISSQLWSYVQANAKEGETEEAFLNLTGLSKRDTDLLADLRLVLSKEVDILLNEVGPRILSRLMKESVCDHSVERKGIRGRIDWQRTFSARAVSGNDGTVFVCAMRSQIYDLPENRLFLYILEHIHNISRRFTTDDYTVPVWNWEPEEPSKWILRASYVQSKTNQLLRNPYINRISRLYEITDKTLEITRKSRYQPYRMLAEIADRFLVYQNDTLTYLANELKNQILEPLNKDTLYEIAVLFKVMDCARANGWLESKRGLIGGRSDCVAVYEKDQRILKVYFQRLPKCLAKASLYKDTLLKYGIGDSLRRPDIVLEMEEGEHRRYIIIEVKRSANKGYLVDGVYKLMGYLKDFQGVISDKTKLKGCLVCWSGFGIQEYREDIDLHLFSWTNLDTGIKSILD